MAPNRNAEQTFAPEKNIPEKTAGKREKSEKAQKPKLNTSTVMKCKIPTARNSGKY